MRHAGVQGAAALGGGHPQQPTVLPYGIHPGGALARWSNDPPSGALTSLLDTVFGRDQAHVYLVVGAAENGR